MFLSEWKSWDLNIVTLWTRAPSLLVTFACQQHGSLFVYSSLVHSHPCTCISIPASLASMVSNLDPTSADTGWHCWPGLLGYHCGRVEFMFSQLEQKLYEACDCFVRYGFHHILTESRKRTRVFFQSLLSDLNFAIFSRGRLAVRTLGSLSLPPPPLLPQGWRSKGIEQGIGHFTGGSRQAASNGPKTLQGFGLQEWFQPLLVMC